MKQEIALKFRKGIVVPVVSHKGGLGLSMTFIAEMLAYGYMPTSELADALDDLDATEIANLYGEVIPVLKKSVGAHVKHKPFYPNFPQQVMDATEDELMRNAMGHYWSQGFWQPDFTINSRPVEFESVKFKSLGLVTEAELDTVFTDILKSADSISDYSKQTVEWFFNSGRTLVVPDSIPFKENMCMVAGIYLNKGMWDSKLIKDTTDVLRVVTYLNGGDISLAQNTKFKSLSRKVRRTLIKALERVAKEEDFAMHRNKWIKLLHNLHVGEYSQKLFDMAKKLRDNEKIETFNSKVEDALQRSDLDAAVKLLKTRPGIFARRIIDMLYKDVNDYTGIVEAFKVVVDEVPARNLTQLWGAVKSRDKVLDKRVVFPKGSVAKAYVLRNEVARLKPQVRDELIDVITASLKSRFASKDELGKVYIDPALYECPLPTGMRSASEGLKEVARGTRLPIGNKAALRFFIYWKGMDIDLSASFHDENFALVETIAYYNLRGSGYKVAHSGDITRAPNGASEFIDVDIDSVLNYKKNIRYVAMNVHVFNGPTFAEHEECFAGWMTRDKVGSNEIFEPKTVEQKVDLRTQSMGAMPVIFDLKERKAIWADVATGNSRYIDSHMWYSGNNVENNKASIGDTVEAFANLDNKITLGELFALHAEVRGEIVTDKAEADTVFAMNEGVTPFDIATINSDYL